MTTYTDSQALMQKQKQRLARVQDAALKAHTQAVSDTADFARTLLQGPSAARKVGQKRTPFQRLPRAFPVGTRTGVLLQSLRVVTTQSGGGAAAFLTFSDPAARFILSPLGTRNMAGVPFWEQVNTFYVARAHDLQIAARQQAARR